MKSKHHTPATTTHTHFRPNNSKSRRYQTYQTFKNQANSTNDKENNLSRFWRECRERDIRKRQRISKKFITSKRNHFASTLSQLKLDQKILSNRFQRINRIKNTQKENRRHSTHFGNCSNISIKENINYENRSDSNRKTSNIPIPSFNKCNNLKYQNTEQSENAKIFFENKEYYSSLYYKHNKSHMFNLNEDNNLKHKLKQKWQELKQDVNKLNYFHKQKKCNRKTTKPTNDCNKPPQKDILSTTFMYLPTKEKSIPTKQTNDEHKTYSAPPETNLIINDINEQKDQESHLNESTQQFQSEIVQDAELETPKNEEKAPTENVENVKNILNTDANTINENANHSSVYSLSHLQKSNEYWNYSVRELKNKLINMNVCIDKCIEKKDLIEKIKYCDTNQNKSTNISNKYYTKKSKPTVVIKESKKTQQLQTKNKPSILYDTILTDTCENKQQITHRVDLWIHRWSYRRSFRQLLNSVLGYRPNDKGYICRGKQGDQNYLLMIKSYKKAMLLLHPDKHINSSFEIAYKSAEMFKILINLCDKYKERYEKKF